MMAHPSAAFVAATNWRSMGGSGIVLIQHDILVVRMFSDLSNSASKPYNTAWEALWHATNPPLTIEPNQDSHLMSPIKLLLLLVLSAVGLSGCLGVNQLQPPPIGLHPENAPPPGGQSSRNKHSSS
jgi:hypothetical protein